MVRDLLYSTTLCTALLTILTHVSSTATIETPIPPLIALHNNYTTLTQAANTVAQPIIVTISEEQLAKAINEINAFNDEIDVQYNDTKFIALPLLKNAEVNATNVMELYIRYLRGTAQNTSPVRTVSLTMAAIDGTDTQYVFDDASQKRIAAWRSASTEILRAIKAIQKNKYIIAANDLAAIGRALTQLQKINKTTLQAFLQKHSITTWQQLFTILLSNTPLPTGIPQRVAPIMISTFTGTTRPLTAQLIAEQLAKQASDSIFFTPQYDTLKKLVESLTVLLSPSL